MLRALLALGLLAPISSRSASPQLLIEGWHHRVWGVYPVEKLKASDAMVVTPISPAISMEAAKGEFEPCVVVIRPTVPLRDVQINGVDLVSGSHSIPAVQIDIKRLGYVYVDEPSGSRIAGPMPYPVGTGQFPDPLLSGADNIRPDHQLQFLITVHVPRTAVAGDYVGQLKLGFRREPWMPAEVLGVESIELRLRVRDFALPERSPLRNTSAANLRQLPAQARTVEGLAAFQDFFGSHRQTLDPLLPSPVVKVDAQNQLTVDSSAWEAAVARSFERQASHVFIPVWGFYPLPAQAQGLYFLHHYPLVTEQKWLTAVICRLDKRLTPEFEALFGSYLRHMHGVLHRRGWLDKAYLATMDEPYTYHTAARELDTPTNNYEVIRHYVTFVRQVAPGLKTYCTANPVEGLNGYIDHWCLRDMNQAALARQRCLDHGETFTFCDNYRTFIDYPAVSARSLGWLAWKIGAQGWLTFETLGSYATAWEAPVTTYPQIKGGSLWGLGQMFYPNPSTGLPVGSLRWEMMREGCEDYEYLWLLRVRLRIRPDAVAQRLLDSAANEVVGGAGDAETMKVHTDNATDNSVPHGLRAQIADWIEKLSK
jgi:Domain of unknown function (DUF4091)